MASAATAGKLIWDLDAPTSKFDSQMNRASATAKKTGDDIDKNLSGSAKKTEGAFSRLKETILGVFVGNLITNAVLRIKDAIAQLGKETIETGKNFEQWKVAFDVMLGSGAEAEKMLTNLSDFAMKTPFDLPQVVQGAKSLLAYGISAQKIIPTFSALGSIAAGVGTDKLPQLTLAFGQVRAAGKLTGMELRQFTEAGVPLLEVLAKQSGKTAGQVKEDMENGMAPSFQEVEKAIFSMSKKGGKFFNLLDRQSKTLGGVMSNIRDQVKRLQLAFLGMTVTGQIVKGGFYDVIRNSATKTLNFISDNMEKLSATLGRVGMIVANILVAMKTQFARLAEPLKQLGLAIGNLLSEIGGGQGSVKGFEVVLSILVTTLTLFIKAITISVKLIAEFIGSLKKGEAWAVALAIPLGTVAGILATMWAVNKVKKWAKAVNESYKEVIKLKDEIGKAYTNAKNLGTKLAEIAKQKTIDIKINGAMKADAAKNFLSSIAGSIGGAIAGFFASSGMAGSILSAIGSALASVGAAIAGVVSAPVLAIVAAVIAVFAGAWFFGFTKKGKEIRHTVGQFFTNLFNSMKDKAQELAPKIIAFVKNIPNLIGQAIIQGIPALARIGGLIIGHIIASLVGANILLLAGIVRLGVFLGQALWKALTAAFNFAKTAVLTGIQAVGNFFLSLYTTITNIMAKIPGIIMGVFLTIQIFLTITVPQIITNVVNWFKALPGKILAVILNLPNVIKSIFDKVKSFVTTTVPQIINSAVNWFRKLPGLVMDAIKTLPGKLLSFGKTLIQKIGDGISSALGGIYSWGKSVISSFLNGIKDAIGSNPILKKALKSIGVNLEAHSPPKEGPLKHIDVWGVNLGKTFVGALSKGMEAVNIKGLNSIENTMAPEVKSSGDTNNINRNVYITNEIGSVNLANDVDADKFIQRLTQQDDIVSRGLTPQRYSYGQ